MNVSVHAMLKKTRFRRLFSGFEAKDPQTYKEPFVEKFGSLLDLKGAMTLSKSLESLALHAFDPSRGCADEMEKQLLDVHRDMVRRVAKGFLPRSAPAKDRLPTPAEYHSHCRFTGVYDVTRTPTPNNPAAAFSPYRKFYVVQQTSLANAIGGLRSDFRKRLMGLSKEGAQLGLLDRGVQRSLSLRIGLIFDGIPDSLGARFRKRLDRHWPELPLEPAAKDWEVCMRPDGWLGRFSAEMKALLLAEIEMRLLPVLGLVEAADEMA